MIQDFSNATNTAYYWGYGARVVPCTNDAGSCAYLDSIYHSHELSMLYSWIMWTVIGSLLVLALILRLVKQFSQGSSRLDNESILVPQKTTYRGVRGLRSWLRGTLLPESMTRTFGHVSRVQLLTLAVILTYLLVFSMIGIVYKKWVTPVKNSSLHNTRTGLGPFSNRVGVLAYALTPLTIILATRESVLSLLTGIPHHHFMFLHRWTGRIIYVQSALHTIGWTIIEAKLYQPQPTVWKTFISHQYIIFGIVAMALITFLTVFSFSAVIKRTGYEFFRKSHLLVAVLYIAACWGHWNLLRCWMIASFILLGLDLVARMVRVLLIHTGFKDGSHGIGYRAAQAVIKTFHDSEATIVRIDFDHSHKPWSPGQHFYLTFPTLNIWQSHPFTPLSSPVLGSLTQHHTYIIRAMRGQTAKLAALEGTSTPVILNGPYGASALDRGATNILAVAGGTGITFTLPIVHEAVRKPASIKGAVHLVWLIRETSHLQWILPELLELKTLMRDGKADNLVVDIFVTRQSSLALAVEKNEDSTTLPFTKEGSVITSLSQDTPRRCGSADSDADLLGTDTPNFSMHVDAARPHIAAIVASFQDATITHGGRSQVVASGPSSLGHDLRSAVAAVNQGGKVWQGRLEYDVSLCWDNRG